MVQSIEDYSSQNISNWINWRRSQIQIYILSFLVFFAGEQSMKTPIEVSMNAHRKLLELFLEYQSRKSIIFTCIFAGQSHLWFFFDRGVWRHVFNTRTCAENISYFHVFFEKHHLSLSAQGRNIMFWGEKYNLSRQYKKDHIPACDFLKRPSFQNIWKKYHISVYFFCCCCCFLR